MHLPGQRLYGTTKVFQRTRFEEQRLDAPSRRPGAQFVINETRCDRDWQAGTDRARGAHHFEPRHAGHVVVSYQQVKAVWIGP